MKKNLVVSFFLPIFVAEKRSSQANSFNPTTKHKIMKTKNTTFLFLLLLSMAGIKVSAHNIEVVNADGKTIYYSLADDHIATILSTGIDHIEE